MQVVKEVLGSWPVLPAGAVSPFHLFWVQRTFGDFLLVRVTHPEPLPLAYIVLLHPNKLALLLSPRQVPCLREGIAHACKRLCASSTGSCTEVRALTPLGKLLASLSLM